MSFVGRFRSGSTYDFRLRYEPAHRGWLGYLVETCADDTSYVLSFKRTKLARHSATAEKKEHHLLHYAQEHEMKQLLQVIVDEAAKHGIVASNAKTEAVATKAHLEDMRTMSFRLVQTLTTVVEAEAASMMHPPSSGLGGNVEDIRPLKGD